MATANPPLTQEQIDRAARKLNDAANATQTRQQQLTRDTQRNSQRDANAREASAQEQQDRIRAAQRSQQAINESRGQTLSNGDHAVIDLGRVGEQQQTAFLRSEIRRLQQAGAHLSAGRVRNIDNTPNGRIVEVETSDGRAVHRVPEAAVVRADLYDPSQR